MSRRDSRTAITPAIDDANHQPIFPTYEQPLRIATTHQPPITARKPHPQKGRNPHPRIVINWGGPRPCSAARLPLTKIHKKIVSADAAGTLKEDSMPDSTHDHGPATEITAAQLRASRWPAERSAALMLAAAQRDLLIARSYTAAQLAAEDATLTDPAAELAAWVARMLAHEQWAREQAAASVAVGLEYDSRGPRETGPLGEVGAAAIRRARAAIALMTGDDIGRAAAARRDVLRSWDEDDVLALAAHRPDGLVAGSGGC